MHRRGALVLVCALATAGAARAERAQTAGIVWGRPDARALVETAAAGLARALGAAPADLSPAPPRPTEAAARLARGVTAYGELRLAEARAELEAAAAEAAATGAEGLDPAALADLYLHLGLVRRAEGTETAAWDAFVRAATLAPGRMLDPGRTAPSTAAAFGRARDAVAAAPRGRVVVAGLPAGAALFVDGRPAGGAPDASVELPYGEHLVRVELPGGARWAAAAALGAPLLELEVPPLLGAPPRDAAAAGHARDRGARFALLAIAGPPPDARIELRLVDATSGDRLHTERAAPDALGPAVARALAALGARTGTPPVAGAHAGVAPGGTPGAGSRSARPARPWFRLGWVWWIAGGVAVATATATALALRGGDDGACRTGDLCFPDPASAP